MRVSGLFLHVSWFLGLVVPFAAAQTTPVITDQATISIAEDDTYTVSLADLVYTPSGNYTLILDAGTNYTLSGTTVIPDAEYSGDLIVPTYISDGTNTSPAFSLLITVQTVNDPPVISAQATISMVIDTPRNFTTADLTFTDVDSSGTFTLTLSSGSNYTFSGLTVTPDSGYAGYLFIPATITDSGGAVSDSWNLVVYVSDADGRPVVTAQSEVSTLEETGIQLSLDMLTVVDGDSSSTDLVLTVNDGSNYSHSGNFVTPDTDITGEVLICMVVNDGDQDGPIYLFTLDVTPVNDPAVLTGQNHVAVDEDQTRTVTLDDLVGSDVDNSWPGDHTVRVLQGLDYTADGASFTPSADYNGTLTVTVVVNDGTDDSDPLDLSVTVSAVNDPAEIYGQNEINMVAGTGYTFSTSDVLATDVDNTWPTDHSVQVLEGNGYTYNGTTVTTAPSYRGTLHVNVRVFDGTDYSAVRRLDVPVSAVDQAPVITGQHAITLYEGDSYTITTNDLRVVDEDSDYPEDFTVHVFAGAEYQTVGNTITPNPSFNGILQVPVRVNDGTYDSNTYTLRVTVNAENDAPVIIGQVPLSTDEETPLEIKLIHLFVDDPDDSYPVDFFLQLQTGNNYRISGSRVIPNNNFNGIMDVGVRVFDGTTTSKVFPLAVSVLPVNDAPYIHGQEPLSLYQGGRLALNLEDFHVQDPDNTYPDAFTLAVRRGEHYTTQGRTVIPEPEFAGTLLVPVTVHDGAATSNVFTASIYVQPVSSQGLPGYLALDRTGYTVNEGAGALTVRIERHAGRTGPLEGVLKTVWGSAQAGDDYLFTQAEVAFADGDQTAKELVIPILEDTAAEGDEYFLLELQSADGTAKTLARASVNLVDNEDDLPVTHLLAPADAVRLPAGADLRLEAAADTHTPGTPSFVWEVRGPAGVPVPTDAAAVQTLRFDTPGTYQVTCYAVDAQGRADLHHARRTVTVTDGPVPEIRLVADTPAVLLDTTTPLRFHCEVAGGTGTPRWYLSGRDTPVAEGVAFADTLTTPGSYTLRVVVDGPAGTRAEDWLAFDVAPPGRRTPLLRLEASRPAGLLRGDTTDLTAHLSDPDGLMPNPVFFWDLGDGRVRTGAALQDVLFAESGRQTVRCTVRAGAYLTEARLDVSVVDPYGAPTVAIDAPTDIELRPQADPATPTPADSVFLQARVKADPGNAPLMFYWDLGDGRTSRHQTPGAVGYNRPGQYQVRLWAATSDGPRGLVDTRTVTVRNHVPGRFEPNDLPELAKPLPQGRFEGLTLQAGSPRDHFILKAEEDGRVLHLGLTTGEPLHLTVTDPDGARLGRLSQSGRLQWHARAGVTYLVTAELPDPSSRDTTHYALDVAVSGPALYVPEVRCDPEAATLVDVVNPHADTVPARIDLFDAAGNLLGGRDDQVPPSGALRLDMDRDFPASLARRTAWLRIQSDAPLIGQTLTRARDRKSMYATPASQGLAGDLAAPHVAADQALWFTRAEVVRPGAYPDQTTVTTGHIDTPVSHGAFGATSLDLGALEAEDAASLGWAALRQQGQAPGLAGIEVFGTRDGARRLAGLPLVAPADTTDTPTTRYLAHIARDTAVFWTGVALLNPLPEAQAVTLTAFDDDGYPLGSDTLLLERLEKRALAAEDLLAGVPPGAAWARIDGAGPLLGFELFGTHDGTRLAGLSLVGPPRDRLFFPMTHAEAGLTQALALVNPSSFAVTPRLRLYDPHGDLLAERDAPELAATQKRTFTFRGLFPHLPEDRSAGWLEVRADARLVGFQLLLGDASEEMAAAQAGTLP